MSKLTPRDGFVSSTEINSQRGKTVYRVDKTGKYNVDNPAHVKALKSQGFTESNLAVSSVGQCISNAVRRWQFPTPEGGGVVTVNYPFTLQRSE